jgi:hypothetical protein
LAPSRGKVMRWARGSDGCIIAHNSIGKWMDKRRELQGA